MPHQRLLVSLCHAAGVEVDAVGERSLRGWDGSTISCTGVWPELLKG